MRPLALALFLVAVAGCVTPAPDTTLNGNPTLPFPDPMGQTHDHSDASLHANSYHFQMTDHQALSGSATHGSGTHALDARKGWLFAADYGGDADAEGGFFILNLTSPEKPTIVGRYRFPGPLGGDRSMEVTDDANYVAFGTEAVDCAGHASAAGPGLYLVDVRDKANPVPVDYLPSLGVHSVTIHRIGDTDYIFGLMPNQNIIKIDRSGPKARLVPVGQVPIGHDSVVVDDELLGGGKALLYASNGGAGFDIWDVTNPATPAKVGAWNIPDRPKDKYYIHTGAVQFIDGRRIAVVTTEDWTDYPSAMFVLDATKLDGIETLANWSAPGDHAADGLRYSMHNPRFLGNTLILAYYHGGVWALDLSTQAKREHPQVVGQYMPNLSNGWKPTKPATSAYADKQCGQFHLTDAPEVFDVEPGDGVVYVADLTTGLYTIKPTW